MIRLTELSLLSYIFITRTLTQPDGIDKTHFALKPLETNP